MSGEGTGPRGQYRRALNGNLTELPAIAWPPPVCWPSHSKRPVPTESRQLGASVQAFIVRPPCHGTSRSQRSFHRQGFAATVQIWRRALPAKRRHKALYLPLSE
jgi:hypothetical protein